MASKQGPFPRTLHLADPVRDLLVQAAVVVLDNDPHGRPVAISQLVQQLIAEGCGAILDGDVRNLRSVSTPRFRQRVRGAKANAPRTVRVPDEVGDLLVRAAAAVQARDPFARPVAVSQLAAQLLEEGSTAIINGAVRSLTRTRLVRSGRKPQFTAGGAA